MKKIKLGNEPDTKALAKQCAIHSVSVAKRTVCKPCNGTGGNSGLGIAYFKCVHCNGTGLQTER